MGGGRAAPRLEWQCAQKDGCAQRTGAHARPKPTSFFYIFSHYVIALNDNCITEYNLLLVIHRNHILETLTDIWYG